MIDEKLLPFIHKAAEADLIPVFAYDGEADRNDPHAVRLAISALDAARIDAVRENEKPGPYDIGLYVTVTDVPTGVQWEIASAPCGAGCHCAATARRLV
jgi:hypothetical protein